MIPNVAAFPRKWPDACDDAEMIAWVPRSGERGYVGGFTSRWGLGSNGPSFGEAWVPRFGKRGYVGGFTSRWGLGSNGPSFGEAWVPRSGERGYVDVCLRIWLQWAFYKSGFTGWDAHVEPTVFLRNQFGFGHPFHGG